jgi:hypothetical protein
MDMLIAHDAERVAILLDCCYADFKFRVCLTLVEAFSFLVHLEQLRQRKKENRTGTEFLRSRSLRGFARVQLISMATAIYH